MADFLFSILTFITNIGSFTANLVTGVLQLVKMIPEALTLTSTAIGALPPVIAVFATAMVSVSVVYLVIGR